MIFKSTFKYEIAMVLIWMFLGIVIGTLTDSSTVITAFDILMIMLLGVRLRTSMIIRQSIEGNFIYLTGFMKKELIDIESIQYIQKESPFKASIETGLLEEYLLVLNDKTIKINPYAINDKKETIIEVLTKYHSVTQKHKQVILISKRS